MGHFHGSYEAGVWAAESREIVSADQKIPEYEDYYDTDRTDDRYKKEKSCGTVVFRREKGGLVFLIETMALGYISLPKGHVENGETEEGTAHREIWEETGLRTRVDTRFRHTISYSPALGWRKTWCFSLRRRRKGISHLSRRKCEKWSFSPMEEALNILTYASDREVLRAAEDYLNAEA